MQTDVCAESDTRRTVYTKGESFSVLTLNLSLMHVPASWICDITTSLNLVCSSMQLTPVLCGNFQYTYTESGLISKKGSYIKQLKFLNV